MIVTRRQLREFKEKVRYEVEGVADDTRAKSAMRLRSDPRILERWMGYTGAETADAIDYSNPCVEIEFIACDPSMLNLAATDGEAFMQETGCDREVFMAHYDQSAKSP